MLSSFLNTGEAGPDLATLVKFVADGSLTVEIGWRGTWDRIAEAVRALRGRRVSGKAILDVSPVPRDRVAGLHRRSSMFRLSMTRA
jgi:NADPH:quinone reductase